MLLVAIHGCEQPTKRPLAVLPARRIAVSTVVVWLYRDGDDCTSGLCHPTLCDTPLTEWARGTSAGTGYLLRAK